MFIAYTAFNIHTTRYGDRWKAKTTGNGPNDAGHVVWALGECFPFFPSYLLILMHICYLFSFYSTYYAICDDGGNAPQVLDSTIGISFNSRTVEIDDKRYRLHIVRCQK